jgi:hypothetical protein
MKLKMLLASCVIALAACANIADNGPNATDANILQGAEVAYNLGKGLYDAGKLNDDDAEAIVLAIQSVVTYVKASRAAGAAGDKAGEAAYLRAAADALDQIMLRLAAKKG